MSKKEKEKGEGRNLFSLILVLLFTGVSMWALKKLVPKFIIPLKQVSQDKIFCNIWTEKLVQGIMFSSQANVSYEE